MGPLGANRRDGRAGSRGRTDWTDWTDSGIARPADTVYRPIMRPEETTLLAVLVDCFEKNEVIDGCFHRWLPLGDPQTADRKFREFRDELARWKGSPRAEDAGLGWQRADWGDIRIKQGGRGIMVWVARTGVRDWWHAEETWDGDPLADVWDWDSPSDPPTMPVRG